MLEFHQNSGNIRREHGPKIGNSGNCRLSSSSASSGILLAPTCHQHDDPPSPPSPPLWSNTSHPLLPTNARSQAIARGRWELMEMLKDVPESAYELSLKDLVERVAVKEKEEPKEEEGQNRGLRKKKKKSKKGNGGGWEQNYGNGGLLLKMFVPSSYLASKPAAGSGRVSPRPLFMVEGKECGGGSGGDNWEWWRKGFMVVGFGRNSRSSSSGSSNSNRSGGSSSSSSRYPSSFS
ncbi:hypothetical protein EJ110_NYTH25218 [Nymphaea thermarum]|nr:hypothetical protein EJ110_NYTH25218 [Nymphaea thermarum]